LKKYGLGNNNRQYPLYLPLPGSRSTTTSHNHHHADLRNHAPGSPLPSLLLPFYCNLRPELLPLPSYFGRRSAAFILVHHRTVAATDSHPMEPDRHPSLPASIRLLQSSPQCRQSLLRASFAAFAHCSSTGQGTRNAFPLTLLHVLSPIHG
jgi:hypothetical protein